MTNDQNDRSSGGPYILDACVIIDYQKTWKSVLKLFARHFGPVYVAEPVLTEEIRQFPEQEFRRLGVGIAKPELVQLAEAAQWRGPISKCDAVNLVLARDNGWTIVTNDRRLCKEAEIWNVRWVRGLRPLIMLVGSKHLSGASALSIARKMQITNPGFLGEEVWDAFREEIRGAELLARE